MNSQLRAHSFLLAFAALVVAVLAPYARADEDEPGDSNDVHAIGILYNGPLHGFEPDGEESDIWTLMIYQGSNYDLDVSAALENARTLNGQAVEIDGSLNDAGKLVVEVLVAKKGGITEAVEGVLGEPQVGFDAGALGWHIVDFDGRLFELNRFVENTRTALVGGARVRVEIQLGVGLAFYESEGYQIEFEWTVLSLETLDGLNKNEIDGFLTLSPHGPGVPEVDGQSEPSHLWYLVRADGSITPLSQVMLMHGLNDLNGKAVAISGQMDENDRFFTIHTIRALKDGITRTVEGTLGEPQVGFDDGALGWHVVTADGTVEMVGALDAFNALVGAKVRIELRLTAHVEFYEASGERLAAGWEPLSVNEIDD